MSLFWGLILCPCFGVRVLNKSFHLSHSFHVISSIIFINSSPLFLTFFLTCSSHLYIGWPLCLLPPNLYSIACLHSFPICILLMWPYHLLLLSSIIFCVLSNFKIFLALVFCILSLLVFPSVLLKTVISLPWNLPKSFLITVNVPAL